jgi:hypothetical protein
MAALPQSPLRDFNHIWRDLLRAIVRLETATDEPTKESIRSEIRALIDEASGQIA